MKQLNTVKTGESTFQVDLRGWMCPYPKYAVEPLLDKLPQGSQLDLLVDCPAATGDVPRLARRHGYTVPVVEQIGAGEWRISILRG